MKIGKWKIERVSYPNSKAYNKKLWSVMFRSPSGGWIGWEAPTLWRAIRKTWRYKQDWRKRNEQK